MGDMMKIQNYQHGFLDQTQTVTLLVPNRASAEQLAADGFGLTRRVKRKFVTDA
jgi:hypothetical protein